MIERLYAAVDGGDREHMPDLHQPGGHQRGQRQQQERGDVLEHHEEAPELQLVGCRAAEERQRHRGRGGHQAQGAQDVLGPRQLPGQPPMSQDHHLVAGHGGEMPEPVEAEVAVLEDAEYVQLVADACKGVVHGDG